MSTPSNLPKVTPHEFKGNGPGCATCGLGPDARVHTEKAASPLAYEFMLKGQARKRQVKEVARTFTTKERKADAKAGKALPDGSFPIENAGDLANAIQALGRAKDPKKAKAHIKARAKALGLTDKLPASWGSEKATERAFLTQVGDTTLLTARAQVVTDVEQLPREMAAAFTKSGGNRHFLWVQGRYVEADTPNQNGAFWTLEDLELGEPTVQYGPVNMLHQERHIVGAITDAQLVRPDREAADLGRDRSAHIAAQSVIWRFLFPGEAGAIERASESGHLWLSMECQAEKIRCSSSPDGQLVGCGREYAWADYAARRDLCSHIRERSCARRFMTPSFLGSAIVLPPAQPAWGAAEAEVMKEAATVLENWEGVRPNLPDAELEALLAQVVAYGKGL